LGIDRSELSPELQRKVVYAGTQGGSFPQGSADLAEYLDLHINAKQVERVTERIGQQRCTERDAAVAAYQQLPLVERKDKPAAVVPPALAVVGVDGGRLQVRGEHWGSPASTAAAPLAAPAAEEPLPADDQHRGQHWREDKIGLLMTMTSEVQDHDPCPDIPPAFVDPTRIVQLARELKTKKAAAVADSPAEPAAAAATPETVEQVLQEAGQPVRWQPPAVATKQLTATRQPWPAFGPHVAARAWSLGFYQAARQAFIGDGAANNWTLWRKHFSSFVPILDFIHALSYVFAAATAGRPFAEGWPCYVRWIGWVWRGQVEQVIVELAQRQVELGLPQPSEGETQPRVLVAAALGYLQNHQDKMRYPAYRQQGLPIVSSYVESAVKQFNQRVKGTEKFWTEEGAEALLQLRADYLSTPNSLEEFWQTRQAKATGQVTYAQSP